MDSRITKSRLSRVLSYDWLKIIAIIVAIIFVWSLAFAMGAPRISVGQTFDLFVYDSDFTTATNESDMISDAKNKNVFSYDVLDFGSRQFTEDYFNTLMSAITTTGEGDIMVISDFESDIAKNKSKFRSLIDGYGYCFYDLESFVKAAKEYCILNHRFITQKGENYVLNEEIISDYFKNRMAKDPRFKTDEKIQAGIKNEIERIKNVWNNALLLDDLLKNHKEIFVKYKKYSQSLALAETDRDKEYYNGLLEKETEKYYGIDLGKLTDGEKDITSAYVKTVYKQKEDGSYEIVSSSASGIVMCAFDYSNMQPDLQFESISFIIYMVKTYSNFIGSPKELIA